MAVIANANGVVRGKFTIPPNVPAGSKLVKFAGSGGSHSSTSFFGEGTLVENVMQKVTTTTLAYYDPLAQTFFLDEARQIVGVDLYVAKKGDTTITVHLRDTSNGYPAQTIIAEATLRPDQVVVGQWNRWTFPFPVSIMGGVEYCVVVMCNDAVSEIGIAEMGKWGMEGQRWVTSQSPNVGVLFSSSNNSTWTAHQDKDMSIRLLGAKYTENSRTIDLGEISANGHTDAIVLATADVPVSGAGFSVDLTLPGGTVIPTGDGQIVRLDPAVTGDIGVRVNLTATDKMSAAVFPGSQLAMGTVSNTADYVSRAFDADAAESKVRVTFRANLPSGSTVLVYLADGDLQVPVWAEVPLDGAAKPIGDGFYEFQYYQPIFNKARGKVKLVLTGTNSARPIVTNLRVSVT